MKFLKLLAHAAFAVLLVAAANAQSTVGAIYGSVADPSGAKVTGAAVVITDVKTGVVQSNKTNGQGDYQFVAVNPSDYVVTVTAPGFKTETHTGVTVDANSNVNVSFTLNPGAKDDTIEVLAGTTMVDTREAQIGETIDQARIEELPTINRDPYELLQTVTGVTGFTPDTLIGSRQGAAFSVNGFPISTSSFYLDGAQNNILRSGGGNKSPNPSMLQEFRIITSNSDAEFGRSPGAILNLITKSGADHYHGELYEFIRNNAFDAKNYFASPGTIINFKQHQFGGTVGGPLPKLYQTFFFAGFEHLQLHQNQYIFPSQWQLPTPAEASGDFSHDPLVLLASNAATVEANIMNLSCNGQTLVICPTNLDPVAVNVMKFVPKADPITGASVTSAAPADNLVNQGLGRIDYNGIPHHSIEATFFDSRGSNIDPGAGGTNQVFAYESVYNNLNQVNGIVADNWIVSNNFVNSARLFYTGNRAVISNVYPDHLLPDLGAAIPVASVRSVAAPPRFDLGNGNIQIGPQTYGPSDINQQQFGVVNVATLSYGPHSIKVGGSYIWDKYAEQGTNYSGGYYNITGDPATVGDRYADFLLGRSNTFQQSTPALIHRRNFDPALFAQDNWHVLPRLTLDLGLRWEVYPPFHGDATSGTFRAGVQSTKFPTAPVGILYEGDRGVAPGIANTPYTDFAPRFGFAWDVYGNGRTSLRGGYGIFFYQQVVDDENRYQMPYGLSINLNPGGPGITSYVNPYPSGGVTASPFPYTPNLANPVFIAGATVYATPPNGGSTPYAEEYNMSVQQQLSTTYALQVSYVGSRFIKQLQSNDINTATPPSNADIINNNVSSVLSRRPYEPYTTNGTGASGYPYPTPGNQGFYFQTITELQNTLNTSYNSLQVTLRGRLGRKINLNSSYVWAKALDNASPVNRMDLRSSYGPASNDIRNRFVLSALMALPTTKRFGRFGREVLNGWRLNGITYIQSGTPFTITTATDENHDGNTGDRPDIIADPYTHATSRTDKIHHYLNPAAFLNTNHLLGTPSLYGSEGRNQLRLPSTTDTNVSLFKEFALPHKTRLQIRAEAFNVLGNVNLTSPRTDYSTLKAPANIADPTFVQLQNAQDPRRLQFGARFLF
ncbi:MAG TPA: carboxypeptidase regulatory-like domain-containing protein [Acidobacteriaceae bacterium]|nr:carboxypeptidase regulatory-like domain-containing protein [Acidobacteriaceae bacterium]